MRIRIGRSGPIRARIGPPPVAGSPHLNQTAGPPTGSSRAPSAADYGEFLVEQQRAPRVEVQASLLTLLTNDFAGDLVTATSEKP